MKDAQLPIDLMFETSWEVCNKVGGIYTVLSTKAKTLQDLYKDRVIFIGPDVWTAETPSPFFKETKSLLKDWTKAAKLPDGIKVRVGRWCVPGKPIAILVDFKSMFALNDELYGQMWNEYGVDSLHAYGDYGEACAFSHAAGKVIESLYGFYCKKGDNVIAHFDEWTTGMGLLYTKSHVPAIATVFTTHATSIGRSICGNGKPLYDYLKGYNGDQMARELNMEAKHSLEKTAAHQADCFTTVSDITAVECEQLLDLRPKVVTPNGFENNFVPVRTKYKSCRAAARRKMLDVASALFGRKLTDDTFIVATSGRCEYRNKGIDVYLDSMKRLSESGLCRDVLSFVMVPAWSGDARFDLREAMAKNELRAMTDPVITHQLHNYDSDPIVARIHQLGFANDGSSNVNVVYVPCYLNGDDGIFDMSYYDLLIGMDATVFPSYYEPWGYTPLESVAFGVPTVTTDKSGFGQWVNRTFDGTFQESGVTVLGRNDSNYAELVGGIANAVKYLVCCDPEQYKEISAMAVATSDRAAWKYFIKYYVEAYSEAFAACASRNKKTNK